MFVLQKLVVNNTYRLHFLLHLHHLHLLIS